MKAKLVGARGAIYCQCGASFAYNVSGGGVSLAGKIIRDFFTDHHGEGHGPASASQAARARRKAEAKP